MNKSCPLLTCASLPSHRFPCSFLTTHSLPLIMLLHRIRPSLCTLAQLNPPRHSLASTAGALVSQKTTAGTDKSPSDHHPHRAEGRLGGESLTAACNGKHVAGLRVTVS